LDDSVSFIDKTRNVGHFGVADADTTAADTSLGEGPSYDESFETPKGRAIPSVHEEQRRLNQAMTVYRPAVESMAEVLAYETVFKKLATNTKANTVAPLLAAAGRKLSLPNLAGPVAGHATATAARQTAGLIPYMSSYALDPADQANFAAKTDTPTYQPYVLLILLFEFVTTTHFFL